MRSPPTATGTTGLSVPRPPSRHRPHPHSATSFSVTGRLDVYRTGNTGGFSRRPTGEGGPEVLSGRPSPGAGRRVSRVRRTSSSVTVPGSRRDACVVSLTCFGRGPRQTPYDEGYGRRPRGPPSEGPVSRLCRRATWATSETSVVLGTPSGPRPRL